MVKQAQMVSYLVIFALLCQMTLGKMYVVEPPDLREKYVNGTETLYGNFGFIKYGEMLEGPLFYNPMNPTGCHHPDTLFKISEHAQIEDKEHKPIILMSSDGCSFVQKTRNVEKAGGAAALIFHKKWENLDDTIMGDDGSGQGIQIPAVLIHYDLGIELRDQYIKFHEKASLEAGQAKDDVAKDDDGYTEDEVVVKFDFNLYGKDEIGEEIVDYSIWYTNADPHSIRLLRHLGVLLYHLSDLTQFTPGIVSYNCNKMGCDEAFKKKNCLSDGKYCSMGADARPKKAGILGVFSFGPKVGLGGKDELLEDLREYCVHETFKNVDPKGQALLFEYIQKQHLLCEDTFTYSCHKVAIGGLMPSNEESALLDIERCVNSTFSYPGKGSGDSDSKNGKEVHRPNYSMDDNDVLKKMQKEWLTLGTHLYPSVVINNITFRGEVTPDHVFEAICSEFEELPTVCTDWYNKVGLASVIAQKVKNERGATVSKLHLVSIIVLILLCLGGAFVLYRKSLNAGLEQEKDAQVKQAVNQFVALQKHKMSASDTSMN